MPTPDALSCKDLEVWGKFLELFQQNARQGVLWAGEAYVGVGEVGEVVGVAVSGGLRFRALWVGQWVDTGSRGWQ